jgi:hypothetical protein
MADNSRDRLTLSRRLWESLHLSPFRVTDKRMDEELDGLRGA